ncbi:MAG: hypothetical protein IJ325_10205 [Clostridia bacterium]|nr:hypothetical protein [Clostridia bacterium]
MFKKTKHWTKSKNVNSKRYKLDLANYLHGKALKCVTEKVNGIEEVVAKKGSIIRKEDELLVFASQDVVMRANVLEVSAWELLSLEGVVITAPDLEHGGEERTIVAYYSYWRELED